MSSKDIFSGPECKNCPRTTCTFCGKCHFCRKSKNKLCQKAWVAYSQSLDFGAFPFQPITEDEEGKKPIYEAPDVWRALNNNIPDIQQMYAHIQNMELRYDRFYNFTPYTVV